MSEQAPDAAVAHTEDCAISQVGARHGCTCEGADAVDLRAKPMDAEALLAWGRGRGPDAAVQTRDELLARHRQIVSFLMGESGAYLNGVGFATAHLSAVEARPRRTFWWREHVNELGAIAAALSAAPVSTVQPDPREAGAQTPDALRALILAIREADARAIRKEDAATGDVSFYTLASGLWHRILGIVAATDTPPDDVAEILQAVRDGEPITTAVCEDCGQKSSSLTIGQACPFCFGEVCVHASLTADDITAIAKTFDREQGEDAHG